MGNKETIEALKAKIWPVDKTATNESQLPENYRDIDPATGLQKGYVTLSEAERARGFVRPVRVKYVHKACGQITQMSVAIAETYARDPTFYSGTFCSHCLRHFPVAEFRWEGTTQDVGS